MLKHIGCIKIEFFPDEGLSLLRKKNSRSDCSENGCSNLIYSGDAVAAAVGTGVVLESVVCI